MITEKSVELTKILILKLRALKNLELPSPEDYETIKKKIFIIKQTVIVTHSRLMSALFKEALKVTK
jgi:hypothetical protein